MLCFQPTRAEFRGLCFHANTIPIYASLLSDQLTPVSACERIVAGSEPARQYHETLNKAQRWSRCCHNPVTRMR